MWEAAQRIGATTLGYWVLANIVLFFAHDDVNIWMALVIFFAGVFIGNVIITYALVILQSLLALVFIKEMRTIDHGDVSGLKSPDWEGIARKTKPVKSVIFVINCIVTTTIAHWCWQWFVVGDVSVR